MTWSADTTWIIKQHVTKGYDKAQDTTTMKISSILMYMTKFDVYYETIIINNNELSFIPDLILQGRNHKDLSM